MGVEYLLFLFLGVAWGKNRAPRPAPGTSVIHPTPQRLAPSWIAMYDGTTDTEKGASHEAQRSKEPR